MPKESGLGHWKQRLHRTHGLIHENLPAFRSDFVHVRQPAVAAAFDGERGDPEFIFRFESIN